VKFLPPINNKVTPRQHEREVLTGEHFMNGDEACAEGGLAAGCKFFGGYPITPATEVAERMARRLPQVGGIYIQMEDEIASICAVLGASSGGAKSMTATSGPGFSLMMENVGLGMVMEIPCVIVNIQRGGPSTGLPTLVGQADMMQAKWGSHGDYEVIALSPSSPQECFDFVIKAFNLSEQYRMPVFVMADEVVGHMTEKVIIPPPNKIKLRPRRKPKKGTKKLKPFKPNKDLVPPMANAGDGYHVHFTGLTHDEKGYPVINAKVQELMVRRLIDKIKLNADKIIDIQEYNTRNADVVLIAYGISARAAYRAMLLARKKKHIKVGLIKLNTVWPFPEKRVKALAKKVKGFIVPEVNYGQIALEVERCAAGKAKTVLLGHAGGAIHTPYQIIEVIEEMVK
jgi:2-oxoglutarate ferredoxin oxidoreductase subunit alpha